MSHDAWRDSLRGARTASAVAEVLAGELPSDGLQHAGNAILTVDVDDVPASMVHAVSESLRRRGWVGDVELAHALEHRVAGTKSGLNVLAVDLDQLADVLDQSPGVESFIDLHSGSVWPGELVDFDQGPDDFDPDNRERWLVVVGLGSGPGYADMERFRGTITDVALSERVADALGGAGAFRRFRSALERYPDEFTRWHRYRDDARLGRARAWLAKHGYESASQVG